MRDSPRRVRVEEFAWAWCGGAQRGSGRRSGDVGGSGTFRISMAGPALMFVELIGAAYRFDPQRIAPESWPTHACMMFEHTRRRGVDHSGVIRSRSAILGVAWHTAHKCGRRAGEATRGVDVRLAS